MADYLSIMLADSLKYISKYTLTFAKAIENGTYSVVSDVADEDLENNKFSAKHFFDTIQQEIKSVSNQYY